MSGQALPADVDVDVDLDDDPSLDQVSLPRQAADVVALLRQHRDGSLHNNDRYVSPLTVHEFGVVAACLDFGRHYGAVTAAGADNDNSTTYHGANSYSHNSPSSRMGQRKHNEVTPDKADSAAFNRTDLLDLGCYIVDNITWYYDPDLEQFIMKEPLVIHDQPAEEVPKPILDLAKQAAAGHPGRSLEVLDGLVTGKWEIMLPSRDDSDGFDTDPSFTYNPDHDDNTILISITIQTGSCAGTEPCARFSF